MTINVLLQGQSNALLFADRGGAHRMVSDLEAKLGDDVNLIASWGNDSNGTIFSGMDFMSADTDGEQAAILRHIGDLPASVKANPTIILSMWNETDQKDVHPSTGDWVREMRTHVDLVREALGQDAGTAPVVFVPVDYPYGDLGPIRDGMDQLARDPGFNASVSDAAMSLAMNGGPESGNGSSHMGDGDAVTLGDRLADVLAPIAQNLEGGGATPPPQSPEEPNVSGSYDLVMADDFSGGYKTENWGQPFNGGTYWNGAWSWSGDDVNVRDGVLDLTMTKHSDGWWTGGGFNSMKAGNTITYGIMEFDGKVQEATGTMGVFLTWPESDKWPVDGEIDILETPGQDVMHTTHAQGPDGSHWYDSVRNQSYDETQWNHYKLTWLPDLLKIEVNGNTVAEWTDPAMIPDVAHGLGAMGMVVSPNDGWMGPPPDGSTPSQVHVYMDNVAMYQWNGGDPGVEPGTGGGTPPVDPGPTNPGPTNPTPPAGRDIVATDGADTFAFRPGDGYAVGGQIAVSGFEVGEDKLDVVPHTIDGWTYDPWAMETADGTVVQWSWAGEDSVLLKGVKGVTLDQLTNPVAQPPVEPPVDPVDPEPPVDPVDPVDPEEPGEEPEEPTDPETPAERTTLEGGDGKDTMKLNGAFRFDVDMGDGKDKLVLGDDHGDIQVMMDAGEIRGDKILGFDADVGDVLVFRGFADGAELKDLEGDFFKVGGEKFQLVGVDHLAAGDYVFA